MRWPGVALAIGSLNLQERGDVRPEPQRRGSLNQIDAFNLDKARDTEAEVGPIRHYGFHTSAAANILWLCGRDCEDHGTQGCVAGRSWIGDPDDSVLYQSRREEPQRATAC